MLNLSSNTADIIAFLFQVVAVYMVIVISLLNLTRGLDNKELWVSLLSSSVGYLLPTPILTKKMFLVLPSNSSIGVFPDNKTSDFKVQLPKSVSLKGSWECGLAEIQYPQSWYTQYLDHWVQCRQGNVEITGFLSQGYYQNPHDVIDQLNRALETSFTYVVDKKMADPTSGMTTRPQLQTRLRFDPYSQVALLEIQKPQLKNMRVRISPTLARVLGFDTMYYRRLGTYVASRVVDLNNTHALFVYNDLIQPQIVGDTLTPLLDVVAVQGGPGDLVCSRFDKPHYKPVLRKQFFQYPHFFMR